MTASPAEADAFVRVSKLEPHARLDLATNAPREGGGVIGQRRDPLPHALPRRAERLEDLEELVDLGATPEQDVQVAAKTKQEATEGLRHATNQARARGTAKDPRARAAAAPD